MKVFLYHTAGCHLCELAKEEIDKARLHFPEKDFDLILVDLMDDADALERYSLSIPVVKHGDGRELFWPFDVLDLKVFLMDQSYESS